MRCAAAGRRIKPPPQLPRPEKRDLTAAEMARVAELAARNFGVDEEPMDYKGTMTREPAPAERASA